MQRFIASLVLTLGISITAAAYEPFEEGSNCTYGGRVNVIARPAGYYDTDHGPAVEVEGDGRFGERAHQLMTPDEARAFASVLLDAADAAEAD